MIYKALVRDDETREVSIVSCDVESSEEMYETLKKNGYIPFEAMVKPMGDFDRMVCLTCYDTSLTPIWKEEKGCELSADSLNYLLEKCRTFNRELKYVTHNQFLISTTQIDGIIDYLKSIGKEVSIKRAWSGHYLYEGDII